MTSLTASQTIPGEYYLGGFPGTLQYKIDPENIVHAVKTFCDEESDIYRGYSYVNLYNNDESKEEELDLDTILSAIIPDTITGNANSWTPLVIIRKDLDENEIWLKAALKNDATNEIALMTSTNAMSNLTKHGNRGVHSQHPEWFIGHYRAVAPMCFWIELAKRIQDLDR